MGVSVGSPHTFGRIVYTEVCSQAEGAYEGDKDLNKSCS